jgi:hypothetical protein
VTRLCIFISKRFVFGKSKDSVQDFHADWMMSWTGSAVQSNSIVFEICNFLFNYIILNFNQAAMFLQHKQSADQYKLALQKLQYVISSDPGHLGRARTHALQPAAAELDEAADRVPSRHARVSELSDDRPGLQLHLQHHVGGRTSV